MVWLLRRAGCVTGSFSVLTFVFPDANQLWIFLFVVLLPSLYCVLPDI